MDSNPSYTADPSDVETNAKTDEGTTIPVLAEELQAGVRKVKTGGVRVHKTVREHDELVDQLLHREEIDVRRVIKNEVVNGPLPVRQIGDITIVPVVKEVLKIEKQWVLTEELHIVKGRRKERQEQRVTLRREEADVERIDAEGRSLGSAAVKETTPVRGLQPSGPTHSATAEPASKRLTDVRPRFIRKNKILK